MGKASPLKPSARLRLAEKCAPASLYLAWPFLIVVLAAGCASLRGYPIPPAEPAAVVELTDQLTYRPKKVTVQLGQMVQWSNASLLAHTVTADPDKAAKPDDVVLPQGAKAFDSGTLNPGGTFGHSFEVPGTYRYFCIPHEGAGMVGEVVVKAPGTGNAQRE